MRLPALVTKKFVTAWRSEAFSAGVMSVRPQKNWKN